MLQLKIRNANFLFLFRTLASRVSALSIRNRHETLEEKKARKLVSKKKAQFNRNMYSII